jgi:hypothetical protein
MQDQDHYFIERRGGFAGLKACGSIDGDALDPGVRQILEELLDSTEPLACDPGADRYIYIVTRENAFGSITREIPESVMPPTVASVVKAEI